MKILNLLPVFLFLVLLDRNTAQAQSNLLSRIDTNIVVNYNGDMLRYNQYMPLLKTGDFFIANSLSIDRKNIIRELREYAPAQKKNMKMDRVSIEKRIAGSFGLQEKLPLSDADTTIKVIDETGKPLSYYQYVPLVLSGKYYINKDNGKRYLKSRPANNFIALMDHDADVNKDLYYALVMMDNIRVEKSKHKMYLERNGKVVFEFPISLGKHPIGAKQKEGDGRTPEGLYKIDYNSYKAAYYAGFHISYPNTQDSLNAKKMGVSPGKDIMIHGTSEQRSKLKDWTNGCIAISNAHIDTLKKYIIIGIPIQINK